MLYNLFLILPKIYSGTLSLLPVNLSVPMYHNGPGPQMVNSWNLSFQDALLPFSDIFDPGHKEEHIPQAPTVVTDCSYWMPCGLPIFFLPSCVLLKVICFQLWLHFTGEPLSSMLSKWEILLMSKTDSWDSWTTCLLSLPARSSVFLLPVVFKYNIIIILTTLSTKC